MIINNKITWIIIFNLTISISNGQDKEMIIIDSLTQEPISFVQIYYPFLQIGGISNEDGKAIIPKKEGVIRISHINYDVEAFDYKELEKLDTLRLYPKQNVLNEVKIYPYDLKKKLSKVLNEYTKNYSSKNIINYSTYKETNKVNDSLMRLFQIQLNWWSKNYIYDFNSKVEKFNKFNIEKVDYSKISLDSPYTAKGAILDNKDFLKFCHLNFLLNIIRNNTEDIVINSVSKNNDFVEVNFDGKMLEGDKNIYNFKNSSITFKSNVIYNLKLNMVYGKDVIHKSVSKEGEIPYTSKINLHRIELSFKRNFSNKLHIGYFTSEISGDIKINENTKNIKISQKLLINKTEIGKKLKRSDFDLKKPFYKNVKKKSNSKDIKFKLTKKESDFINE